MGKANTRLRGYNKRRVNAKHEPLEDVQWLSHGLERFVRQQFPTLEFAFQFLPKQRSCLHLQ